MAVDVRGLSLAGTEFARDGARRESDRRRLSPLVVQSRRSLRCLCVTPNRRFFAATAT